MSVTATDILRNRRAQLGLRQVAAVFPEVRAPRFGAEESTYTVAKKHPPYVFSTAPGAVLIHVVSYVRLRWWTYSPGGAYLLRLASPTMMAVANCGQFFSLEGTRAKTCLAPSAEAVLCGMCAGKGRNFPRDGRPHEVSRELAKIRKSCITKGVQL